MRKEQGGAAGGEFGGAKGANDARGKRRLVLVGGILRKKVQWMLGEDGCRDRWDGGLEVRGRAVWTYMKISKKASSINILSRVRSDCANGVSSLM